MTDDEHLSKSERPTDEIDPRDVRVSWPAAIASLEQLGDWLVFALRLGTLALIQRCVRDMAETHASAGLVAWMQELTDGLARMPWIPIDEDSGKTAIPGRFKV